MTESEPISNVTVSVNGDEILVPLGHTVADLVAARGLRPAQVAVEINKDIVPRRTHPDRVLAAGDRIEIVTLVGGG